VKTPDDEDTLVMDFPPEFEREEPTRRLATPTESMAIVQQMPPSGFIVAISRTSTGTFGSRDSRLVLRVA
jgi:hypothetical protein